ncbi:hypothetical protein BIW11_09413, partial [Tropilaelaps mercedesae]
MMPTRRTTKKLKKINQSSVLQSSTSVENDGADLPAASSKKKSEFWSQSILESSTRSIRKFCIRSIKLQNFRTFKEETINLHSGLNIL